MNIFTIMMIVYIGIIVITFIAEGFKWIKSQNTITLILLLVFLLILALAGAFYGVYYMVSPSQEENSSEIKEDQLEMTESMTGSTRSLLPSPELMLLNTHQFKLKSTTDSSEQEEDYKEEEELIDYEQFKRISEDPSFISKFTNAIRLSLEMKQKKYNKLKNDAQKELATFSKEEDDFLGNALNKLRNEQYNDIKDYINRIDKLLLKIKSKYSKTCDQDTKYRLSNALYKKDVGLDSIIGRKDIKNFISIILYTFAQNPIVFLKSFQNIVLMAGPGSGKTRIATIMGHVFASSGILIEDNVIITTKAGVISPYVNETAHKTHSFMLSTLESLVFFDEAYDFTPPKSLLGDLHRDHGHEAITQIVNDMDKMQGLHIIVAGGYEKDMKERFLGANEGMKRRFPHQIVLSPYNAKELTAILIDNIQSTNPVLEWFEEMDHYLYTAIHSMYNKNPELFPNQAGDMINLSSEISHAIYGTKTPWPEKWQQTFIRGINHYLESKELKVESLSLE